MLGLRQKLSLGFGGLLLIILVIAIQSIIHLTGAHGQLYAKKGGPYFGEGESVMMDLIYVLIPIIFFGLCVLYTQACGRL